ncbi:MAG: Hsp20/alpha crystallin family protein [Gammaproteobacteria bacterium]|nr:Hsp20/alpha crystallin family protein [Gammaproteobacteria bacterium]
MEPGFLGVDNFLTYSLKLPGLDENDIEVMIDEGRLTVRGDGTPGRSRMGITCLRSAASVALNGPLQYPPVLKNIDVKASMKNGVLII